MKRAVICLAALAMTLSFPASSTGQSARRLSVAQLSNLLSLIRSRSETVYLLPQTLNALNLAGTENSSGLRQLTIRQRSTGVSHGIIVLPKSGGYLLLRGGDPASADNYWVDMNFSLVRSVRTLTQGGVASIPSETGDAELTQEIAFWAMVADSVK